MGIPGVIGDFKDYQQSSAVQLVGSKVSVILGDLPDTVKEAFGDTTREVTIKANEPIIISMGDTAADSFEGKNILNNVDPYSVTDITNILRTLDLARPTAVCKIVKRDGTRPDMQNLFEVYQAMEFAYENLQNYPVSRIIPTSVEFEADFGDIKNFESFYLTGTKEDKEKARKIEMELFAPSYKLVDGNKVTKDPFNIEITNTKIGVGVDGSADVIVNGTTTTLVLKPDTSELAAETIVDFAIDGIKAKLTADTVIEDTSAPVTLTPVFSILKEYEILGGYEVPFTVVEDSSFNPAKSGSFEIELIKETEILGKVELNGKDLLVELVLEDGLLKENIVLELGEFNIELKAGTNFTPEIITDDIIFNMNYVPKNAEIVRRALKFASKMTTDLTECKITWGVLPPLNTSVPEIEKQVQRLVNLKKAKDGFVEMLDAENRRDLGLFLDVVVGSVKISEFGGLTNFEEEAVISMDNNSIVVEKTTSFEEGDPIEVYLYVRQDIISELGKVKTVIQENDEETTLILEKPLSEDKLKNNISKAIIQNVKNKDEKGTYLAALYANVAENHGIETSYIKASVPGSAEISYTRDQMEALKAARYTVINKDPLGTAPYIVDTPTMALSDSDFTDQSTRDLLFTLLSSLREAAKPYIGERFGSADKKALFENTLSVVFQNQMDVTITNFDLSIDYDYLQTNKEIFVDFSVTEARTAKTIGITGRIL